jgi:hypothetical protein
MHTVQKDYVTRFVATCLSQIEGALYQILLPDGTLFETPCDMPKASAEPAVPLPTAEPEARPTQWPAPVKSAIKKPRTKYGRGVTREHYSPLIDGMQAGDVVAVPFVGFDASVLAKDCGNYCGRLWGKGSYSALANYKRKAVIVTRRAPE